MNVHAIEGRIVKFTVNQGENKAVNFTVAVPNYHKKTDNGYAADFFPCVCFGKKAEYFEKNAVQGQKITVSGPEHTESWTDSQGNKRSINKIYADTLSLGEKPKSYYSENGQQDTGFQNDNNGEAFNGDFYPSDLDEDLPF